MDKYYITSDVDGGCFYVVRSNEDGIYYASSFTLAPETNNSLSIWDRIGASDMKSYLAFFEETIIFEGTKEEVYVKYELLKLMSI